MKIGKIYTDGTYLKNNPTWDIEGSPWKAKQVIKIIRKNQLTPKTIADVGCGAGEVLNLLSREKDCFGPLLGDPRHDKMKRLDKNIKFTGYEISPQAYKLCQKIHNSRVEFKLQDILREKVHYDLILALDIIEHVEDYYGYLRRLKAKAEYKIFNIPLDISVQTVIRDNTAIAKTRKQWGHLHHFTKNIALDILRQTGYKVLDYHYGVWSLDLPPHNKKALLLKPIRHIAYALNPDLAARFLGGTSLVILAK
jgi:SAM-dependent methyltransferase